MLSVTPKFYDYSCGFKGSYNGIIWQDTSPSSDRFDAGDMDYDSEKAFWNEQKEIFDNLTDEKNLPKPVRKTMNFFSVLISGVLGAMAMGWASRRSIEAVRKFNKLDKVKNFKLVKKEKCLKLIDKISNSTLAVRIKNSSFAKSSFVQNLKSLYIKTNLAIKNTKNTIKSKINPDKAENAAVKTFGISGGVTSGYAAINQEKLKEE